MVFVWSNLVEGESNFTLSLELLTADEVALLIEMVVQCGVD